MGEENGRRIDFYELACTMCGQMNICSIVFILLAPTPTKPLPHIVTAVL